MRKWMVLCALFLISCATADNQAGSESSADGELRDAPPRWAEPSTEGERLAAEVLKAHGGESWDRVEQITFRFLVVGGTERVFEARHHWNVVEGKNRIVWTDEEGLWDVTLDTERHIAVEGSLNGERFRGEQRSVAGKMAHRRWINDTYWLLMPIKMLDPGVIPTLDPPREHQNRRVEVIRLRFQDVGLTPGDQYWVYVDPQSREVVGWEMQLEGSPGEAVFVAWEDYQEVGPFVLPLIRRWKGGERRIVFSDVQILERRDSND